MFWTNQTPKRPAPKTLGLKPHLPQNPQKHLKVWNHIPEDAKATIDHLSGDRRPHRQGPIGYRVRRPRLSCGFPYLIILLLFLFCHWLLSHTLSQIPTSIQSKSSTWHTFITKSTWPNPEKKISYNYLPCKKKKKKKWIGNNKLLTKMMKKIYIEKNNNKKEQNVMASLNYKPSDQ